MVELALNCSQIIKDIAVIKLQIIHYQRVAMVVDKLRALIKKGTVILIRLNNKIATAPRAQACRETKIQRYTADQKSRFQTGIFKNHSNHTASSSLAMSAGNRDDILVTKNILPQPLGSRGIDKAIVEHIFNTRITPGHGVANNNQIRCWLKLLGIKALDQLDAGQF